RRSELAVEHLDVQLGQTEITSRCGRTESLRKALFVEGPPGSRAERIEVDEARVLPVQLGQGVQIARRHRLLVALQEVADLGGWISHALIRARFSHRRATAGRLSGTGSASGAIGPSGGNLRNPACPGAPARNRRRGGGAAPRRSSSGAGDR